MVTRNRKLQRTTLVINGRNIAELLFLPGNNTEEAATVRERNRQ